jgi:hypothetical protein
VWDFIIGQDFAAQIQDALNKSKRFIIVLSKEYLSKKGWSQREWTAILSKDPTLEKAIIIPIWIEDMNSVSDDLGLFATINAILLYDENDEKNAEKILLNGVSTEKRPRVRPSFPGIKKITYPGGINNLSNSIQNVLRMEQNNKTFDYIIEKIFERQDDSGKIRGDKDNIYGSLQYKPVFFTMYTISLVYNNPKYEQVTKEMIQLLYNSIDPDGFVTVIVKTPELPIKPGGDVRFIEKSVRVYRHTAETLTAFLLTKEINETTLTLLKNLLIIQNDDGGWGGTQTDTTSQLLSTTFAIQALNQNNITELYKLSSECESLEKKVNIAKAKGLEWLVARNKEGKGFWYTQSSYYNDKYHCTGFVIDALADLFLEGYPSFTETLVERIKKEKKDFYWPDNSGKPDVLGTVALISALLRLRNAGMKIVINDIEETKHFILSYINESTEKGFETGILCYAANLFLLT